jgi:hypothetical protein
MLGPRFGNAVEAGMTPNEVWHFLHECGIRVETMRCKPHTLARPKAGPAAAIVR